MDKQSGSVPTVTKAKPRPKSSPWTDLSSAPTQDHKISRSYGKIFILYFLTLGLYGDYLSWKFSKDISRITSKRSLDGFSFIVLSVLTLTLFNLVYIIIKANQLDKFSSMEETPNRNSNLGLMVLALAIGGALISMVSAFLFFIFAMALFAYIFCLMQNEIDLYD